MPYVNSVIKDEYGTYTVDADRARRVAAAIEYIRETKAEVGGTAVIAETRVFPDGLVRRADMSGTVDIQIPSKSVYVIADLKDGMSPVSAVENPQLEQYALGVLAGLAVENYPRKFRLVIFQPNLAKIGQPILSTWEITPAELLARVPAIIAQAAATDAPDAPLVPGETQCKYCRAKGSCSAQANKAMEKVGLMFGPVNQQPQGVSLVAPGPAVLPSFLGGPAPQVVTPDVMPPEVMDMAQQAAAKDPTKMNDAQLRQVMEAAPLVRAFLKGVEEQIEQRLLKGVPVPGFKLVRGKGSREWALSEEEMVKKLTGMGISKEAIYKKTLISPAQAEGLVWTKKDEPQQLSDTQKKRMEKEYIKHNPGKLTVAPESDSRPAVAPLDASELFEAVNTTPPTTVPAFLQAQPANAAPPTEVPAFLQAQPSAPAGLPDWLK